MADNVTLEFLGRQMERIFGEIAELRSEQAATREDIRVLTANVLRHDSSLSAMIEQLHAMTSTVSIIDWAGSRNSPQNSGPAPCA